MLKPAFLYNLLAEHGVEYTLGVPDSLLKDYCSYAYDQGNRLIAANEGNAIAIASGYHLATGNIPLVYLQNSGFGNTINPLTSLADKEVYSIPMILMIGWRGQPGIKDEPQHIKQGRTMEAQLKAYDIPYFILSENEGEVRDQITRVFKVLHSQSRPVALLIPPNTFEKYVLQTKTEAGGRDLTLKREQVLEILVQQFEEEDIVVSTTGKTSRELFELREKWGLGHQRDFLTVGSMGHVSQIALGIALEKPERTVFCIDGDGSVIMHMGGLAIIGEQSPANFKHILINNGAHESVGGQPTAGFNIDFGGIAESCGYKDSFQVKSAEELENILPSFFEAEGPVLLEILTKKGARSDLGRPDIAPVDNKKDFMKFLSKGSK